MVESPGGSYMLGEVGIANGQGKSGSRSQKESRRSRGRPNAMWLALLESMFQPESAGRCTIEAPVPGPDMDQGDGHDAHQCGGRKFLSGGRRMPLETLFWIKNPWMDDWMTSWTKWYIFSLGLSMIFWNLW